jgi:hypothetical protein
MGSLEDFLFKASLGYFQHIVDKNKNAGADGEGPNPVRDGALLRLKNKAGAVTVLLGTRETGKCIGKSTPLQLTDGRVILAGDCKAGDIVFAMGEDLKIRSTPVLLTADMGLQRCLKTKLRSGRSIVSTPEHPFYTIDGWVKIEDIPVGGRVAIARYLPIEGATHNKELNDLATSDIYWDEIVSKEEIEAEVCDLMTEEHNFIANDIVAHNTTLSYVVAKALGRPTYAISPQQTPPPWITPITLNQIWTKLPSRCTLILDDMPAYASNRDYTNELVKNLERLVPMVRHEPHPPEWPVGEIQLIFSSQSAAQADKYMLDCDCVFFKPLGLLYEDYERQNIKRIYRDYVNAYFNGKDHDWVLHHAWMRTPEYNGGIFYNQVTAAPAIDPAFQPSHP